MNRQSLGRLALLSRFFPGVLHELSQPLSQLRMRLDLAAHKEQAPPELLQKLSHSVDELCNRLEQAETLLRDTSQAGSTETVADLCGRALRLVNRYHQRHGIEFSTVLEPARVSDTTGMLWLIAASMFEQQARAVHAAGQRTLVLRGELCDAEYILSLHCDGPITNPADAKELAALVALCHGDFGAMIRLQSNNETGCNQLVFPAIAENLGSAGTQ